MIYKTACSNNNFKRFAIICVTLIVPFLAGSNIAFSFDPSDGMVVAAHPLATKAGVEILKQGGNAADATVAALMVLNVVEPHASGLGGGGFATIKPADQDAVILDFREVAPAGMISEKYFDPADTLGLAKHHGGSAVGVPGTAAGLAMLHKEYGSLPLKTLLEPAIKLAEKGYPVSATLANLIQERIDMFMEDAELGSLFLKDGFPPMEGETLYNPELAKVLKSLSKHGLTSFYKKQASDISRKVQASGGWICKQDLKDYKVISRSPLKSTYRGFELLGPPPPATGPLAVLECLNIIEAVDIKSLAEADRIHLLAEAMKKAYRDRGKRAADPAFYPTPIDSLLDKDLAKEVLAQIHPDAIHHSWPPLGSSPMWKSQANSVEKIAVPMDHGNTTHISIIDEDGMIISLTQSINHFFGAGVAVNGYLLNNQMDDFTFIEGSLNYPTPGKKPRSSMAPMIVTKDSQPVICLGTPGGTRIISATIEILVNHIDLGMPIQQAIDAPRFHPLGATMVIENRLDPVIQEELAGKGYRIYPMGEYDRYFGGAHAISLLGDTMSGGADPRRDGVAGSTNEK
jgi:gamma-glutamyltranspeptidase / glutathione hydrolase